MNMTMSTVNVILVQKILFAESNTDIQMYSTMQEYIYF
jgi:hypothetical protein